MNGMPGKHRTFRQMTAAKYIEGVDMTKRKTIKAPQTGTASYNSGTTQVGAEWTENDTDEYVYALRVMTTKRGKPRKKRAYARKNNRGHWWIAGESTAWLVGTEPKSVSMCRETAETHRVFAEKALGCTCKVVKIAIREVEDDE